MSRLDDLSPFEKRLGRLLAKQESAPTPHCPDAGAVEKLAPGPAATPEALELLAHVAGCNHCIAIYDRCRARGGKDRRFLQFLLTVTREIVGGAPVLRELPRPFHSKVTWEAEPIWRFHSASQAGLLRSVASPSPRARRTLSRRLEPVRMGDLVALLHITLEGDRFVLHILVVKARQPKKAVKDLPVVAFRGEEQVGGGQTSPRGWIAVRDLPAGRVRLSFGERRQAAIELELTLEGDAQKTK